MKKPKHAGNALLRCLGLDYAARTLMPQPLAHLHCDGYITVENCKAICLYTDTALQLDMGRSLLHISGSGLILRTFSKSTLTVTGSELSIVCQKKEE